MAQVRLRPTARLRRLGAAIRRYRLAKGLTLEEAGELMERTPSSLSKIEIGRSAAPIRELRIIFDVYGITDEPVRERLLSLARDARKRGWWEQYGNPDGGMLLFSATEWADLLGKVKVGNYDL